MYIPPYALAKFPPMLKKASYCLRNLVIFAPKPLKNLSFNWTIFLMVISWGGKFKCCFWVKNTSQCWLHKQYTIQCIGHKIGLVKGTKMFGISCIIVQSKIKFLSDKQLTTKRYQVNMKTYIFHQILKAGNNFFPIRQAYMCDLQNHNAIFCITCWMRWKEFDKTLSFLIGGCWSSKII